MNQHDQSTHEINLMRNLSRLDTRLEVLHQDVAEVKGAMHKLAEAITKLAVIEERQSQASHAVERAFAAIAATQAETASLKLQIAAAMHSTSHSSKWIDRALVALVALGVGVLVGGRI